MKEIEVIGVYPVKAEDPCHLIEMVARGVREPFDLGDFTQELPDTPPSHWQVPWREKFLNAEGTKILAEGNRVEEFAKLFRGEVRFTFFFHLLDETKPMKTPFGNINVPKASRKPRRLAMIEYVPVD